VIPPRALLAVAAAVGCVLVGAWETTRWFTALGRVPRWEEQLAPLADMPVPAGTEVALSLPAEPGGADAAAAVLYEAVWRRPDLRWGWLSTWPSGRPPQRVVAVGMAPAPPGWREVWGEGDVRLLARLAP
jgi:hypothetical protein